MVFQPGQSGNPDGRRKERLFREALMMELKAADGDRRELRQVARALINKAAEGDLPAVKEFADRVDGKVPQQQIITGDEEGGPVQNTHDVTVKYVRPEPGTS